MKILLLLILFVPLVPAFANIGFQPVYQPTSLGGGSPPTELYCTFGDFLNSYNSTTNSFTCGTPPAGAVYENNTASNIGLGQGLFKQKTGVNLEFKNIAVSGDLSISSNLTDVTISHTAGGSSALDDLTDVIITSPAYLSTLFYDGANWIDKIFSINSITCGAGQFVNSISNTTGVTACGTPAGVSDGDKTDITVSGSGATWTIDNDVVTYAKMQNVVNDDRFLGRISGANGDTEELTGTQATTLLDVFTSGLKGLAPASGGGTTNFLRADGTWAAPPSGGGITTLGADVTCTATGSYCTVFTIPLTASSGNRINVNLVGDSNTAGGAIQMRVQFDNAGNTGYCVYRTYTTATAEVLDVLAATTTTDTGETVWLAGANVPMPLDIHCGFETDASPGNALVQIQAEVASTITIQKGSHYIKTP